MKDNLPIIYSLHLDQACTWLVCVVQFYKHPCYVGLYTLVHVHVLYMHSCTVACIVVQGSDRLGCMCTC